MLLCVIYGVAYLNSNWTFPSWTNDYYLVAIRLGQRPTPLPIVYPPSVILAADPFTRHLKVEFDQTTFSNLIWRRRSRRPQVELPPFLSFYAFTIWQLSLGSSFADPAACIGCYQGCLVDLEKLGLRLTSRPMTTARRRVNYLSSVCHLMEKLTELNFIGHHSFNAEA